MLPSSGAIGVAGERPERRQARPDQHHGRLALGEVGPVGRMCGVSTPGSARLVAHLEDQLVRRRAMMVAAPVLFIRDDLGANEGFDLGRHVVGVIGNGSR